MQDRKTTEVWATETATDLVARARKAGADSADALVVSGTSLGVSWRLGALEDVEREETADLGLRVFIGKRQAIIASSDISPAARDELVERAVAMAKATPEDPFAGIADTSEPPVARSLDLFDNTEPDAETLIARAQACEDVARSVDGITNSEGAGASWTRSTVGLANSVGFAGAYSGTRHSVSVSVLAGTGTAMERDYAFHTCRHLADLESAEEVGQRAAERTLARLNAGSMKSGQMPVVYDKRVSSSLLGHLAGAINGAAIARGTSVLKDSLNHAILPGHVQIIDDPTRKRGLASKLFDAEGHACEPLNIVDGGVLQHWLLDLRSARQLGLSSNGRASRGTGGPPSPSTTNLYMPAGDKTVADLIADIDQGVLITEMIGMGVNGVTGDYSRGASGFRIEKGEITTPVSGITIAGNLKDMFRNLTPADDLEFRGATNAPSLRVEGMTIAGQ